MKPVGRPAFAKNIFYVLGMYYIQMQICFQMVYVSEHLVVPPYGLFHTAHHTTDQNQTQKKHCDHAKNEKRNKKRKKY